MVSKKLNIKMLVTGLFQTNCYIIRNENEAVIIDPGDDAEEIIRACEDLDVRYILLTHAHVDHVGALKEVSEKLRNSRKTPKILMHKSDLFLLNTAPSMARYFGYEIEPPPEPSDFIDDGEEITIGDLSIKAIHTPGHSPGGMSYLFTDEQGKYHLFTGDVLFAGSIGRTDLPGGNYRQLIHSIKTKLLVLPSETIVYPGHGPTTTIGVEKFSNPFLI